MPSKTTPANGNKRSQKIIAIAHYQCPCKQLLVRKTPLSELPADAKYDVQNVLGGHLYEFLGQKAEARHKKNGNTIVSIQDPQDPGVVHEVKLLDPGNAKALMEFLREVEFNPEKAYPDRRSCRLER
ncbi:MAG: hypothetical protein WCX64_04030 [Candidatus Micrarchaeia archaeon]|jgi:hypothetical protein